MISIRQWSYVYSRLSIQPIDLLYELKISGFDAIEWRTSKLNTICKRHLGLTTTQLKIEAESVYNISELHKITNIWRTSIHYRVKKYRVPTITQFPTIYILQQDLWHVLGLPNLAALYKSNPLFQYRWLSHSSINQVCSTLEIPATALMELEYGRLYPTAALCTRLAKLDKSLPKDLRLWYAYYHTVGSKK